MSSSVEKLDKKIRKKRILFITRLVVIIIFLLAVAIIAVRSVYKAELISVVNATEYDTALIMQSISKAKSQPILFFDSNKFETKLENEFPYIKSAIIKPEFPNKINVRVYYDTPIYSLPSENGWVCLNVDLKILEITEEKKENTLTVSGISLSDYSVGSTVDTSVDIEAVLISEIKRELDDWNLFGRVTLLDFSKKYNIQFILDDLISVELGNSDDLDAKFKMLNEILERNPSDEKAVINVRDSVQGRYRKVD